MFERTFSLYFITSDSSNPTILCPAYKVSYCKQINYWDKKRQDAEKTRSMNGSIIWLTFFLSHQNNSFRYDPEPKIRNSAPEYLPVRRE